MNGHRTSMNRNKHRNIEYNEIIAFNVQFFQIYVRHHITFMYPPDVSISQISVK